MLKTVSFPLLLVILMAAASLADCTGTSVLKDIFEQTSEIVKSIKEPSPLAKYARNINLKCSKEKLNLSENGEKIVKDKVGLIVVYTSFLKCYAGDETELLNFILDQLKVREDDDLLTCTKLKFKKIDPTSPLVENFDSASLNASFTGFCDVVLPDEHFGFILGIIEEELGPLESFTCGAINKDELLKYSMKINIVPFETNNEVRLSVGKDMFDTFREKIYKTVDCVIANAK